MFIPFLLTVSLAPADSTGLEADRPLRLLGEALDGEAVVAAPLTARAPAPPLGFRLVGEELYSASARPVTVSLEHSLTAPEVVGYAPVELATAERVVREAVERGAFPGAALAIGRGRVPVIELGIGHLDWSFDAPPVDPHETLYDLASLTKVVATTTAVMLLYEDGLISLDEPVSRYLPAFGGGEKDRVTIRDLLTHTSGLPAWAEVRGWEPHEALARAIATPLERSPGERALYSDIGFVVLHAAAEAAAGEPLQNLLERRIFNPLGMSSTLFHPGEPCGRCAPTAERPDGTFYQGTVHDPIARALGGVAGNAGLFSTLHDLSRFAAMLSNGGELDGVRVLRPETVWGFGTRQPGAGTRALGWDTPARRGSGAAGLRISSRAFGHTGFTGTSMWVDPERATWAVLLTNRTFHPRAPNRIQALRRAIHDSVATAADRAP